MNNLKNKIALITGAASGIGEAIAKNLAKEGAIIVIADMNLQAGEEVARELVEKGSQAIAVKMDVTNEQEVKAGFERAMKEFGGLDILVSNAGIQIVHPIEDYPFSEWKKMQAIHGDGAFLTTQAAYRIMKSSNKGGQIIYTGSVHSHEGSKLKSAYVFAKHGLIGLSKVVAKEGAQYNIHSYVICPGFVKTPLVEKQIPEQAKELNISEEAVVKNIMLKDTIDGQFTTTQEVADTVLFVAKDRHGALSGQSLVVSHGWFMQ